MATTSGQSAEATLRSAKAAEDSVRELRQTREQESAPYIVVYFDASFETSLIYLVIKNIGKTVANNVKVRFDPPIRSGSQGIDVADLPLIKDGVGSIPPGYEIRTLFDSAFSYFGQDDLPLSFKASVSYSGGLRGELITYDQVLDLGALKGLGDVDQRGMDDLVKQVEQLAKNQSETNKTLQTMVRRIERGIWLKNQDFIVRNAGSQWSLWPSSLLAKLSEFRDIWVSVKESEESINLPSSGVQAKCLLLSEQILVIGSKRPANTSEDIVAEVRIIAAKLAELGRMRFYLGPTSDEEFTSAAENIVQKIDGLEARLLSKGEPLSTSQA